VNYLWPNAGSRILFHASENAFAIKEKHGAESQIGRSKRGTGEIPVRRQLHVRFGSLADISARNRDVRFTPESGHSPKVIHFDQTFEG
jgi:hypothetical protein